MAFKTGVVDVDLGFDRIVKEIQELDGLELKIGLFGEGSSPDTNLAYRGHVQEYGRRIRVTDKMRGFLGAMGLHLKATTKFIIIPSRPFMRSAFDNDKNKYLVVIGSVLGRMIVEENMNVKKFNTAVSVVVEDSIKNSIRSGNWAANHPYTVSNKGSSRPLIDNGEMLNGVKTKVVKDGSVS